MTDQTMTPEQALEWLEGLRNTTGDQVCAEIEAGKAAEAAQAFRAALEAAREDAAEAKQNGYELGLLAAAREDGWQPIETAPNEAWFLVHSDRGWIGLARRSDPDYAPDEGWFEDEHAEFLDPEWLTHWRPLPAPPAIDQARGKGVQEVSDG